MSVLEEWRGPLLDSAATMLEAQADVPGDGCIWIQEGRSPLLLFICPQENKERDQLKVKRGKMFEV